MHRCFRAKSKVAFTLRLLFKTPLPPQWLYGVTSAHGPSPSQQHEGLQHTVLQPQQEVTRLKAIIQCHRCLWWIGINHVPEYLEDFLPLVWDVYLGKLIHRFDEEPFGICLFLCQKTQQELHLFVFKTGHPRPLFRLLSSSLFKLRMAMLTIHSQISSRN